MHLSCNTIVAKSSLAVLTSDIISLFHPAFPCSDRLTPGNPPPLKGAKMWLHLSCHQSIQLAMSGYNLATSSSLLFNIFYLHTVVTWCKSLVSVVNTCHISGPMHLAILAASHESFLIEHFPLCFGNFDNQLIKEGEELGYIIFTANFH